MGLILSDFGGLNCMPSESLKKLSLDLQGLISKNGCFIAVVMSRFCWWEIFYFLLKGQPAMHSGGSGKSLSLPRSMQTLPFKPGIVRHLNSGGISPAGRRRGYGPSVFH